MISSTRIGRGLALTLVDLTLTLILVVVIVVTTHGVILGVIVTFEHDE